MSLTLHFAADSHKGIIRDGNEDSGYAGPQLLAVADGMGGQAAGEVASSEAISVIYPLDEDIPGNDLLTALGDAVERANDRLRVMVAEDAQLEGMGCTLTAMLFSGQRVGLVHIGDSRAYLLRDGELQQITTDHKWVQKLVEEGRITAEEAASHPQRNLLMRALDGKGQAEPDLAVREFRARDRYLLCSDGLSDVVSLETMQETLSGYQPPHDTVQELIQLALRAGGPDNITVIVADVLETDAGDTFSGQLSDTPVAVGAVAENPPTQAMAHQTLMSSPAGRAAELGRPAGEATLGGAFGPAEYGSTEESAEQPAGAAGRAAGGGVGGYDIAADYRKKGRSPWVKRGLLAGLVLAVIGGLAYGGWRWTQTQYYVGASDGHVAVFQGVDQNLFGIGLSGVEKEYKDAKLSDLVENDRKQVQKNIGVDNRRAALKKASELSRSAASCRGIRQDDAERKREEERLKQQEKTKKKQEGEGDASKSGALNGQNPKGTGKGDSARKPESPNPSPSKSLSPQQETFAKECLASADSKP